jgi:hypothetical protein
VLVKAAAKKQGVKITPRNLAHKERSLWRMFGWQTLRTYALKWAGRTWCVILVTEGDRGLLWVDTVPLDGADSGWRLLEQPQVDMDLLGLLLKTGASR